MSRFSHILTTPNAGTTQSKIIGLFPFNALVDPSTTDVYSGKIDFLESAIAGLRLLAEENYSVIVFINQFKSRQLPYETFNNLNGAVERFINAQGVKVVGIYWCPSITKNDPYVVPNPGMFHKASENQSIDWSNIPVISSFDKDLLAATSAKAMPVKIGNGSSWTRYATFFEFAHATVDKN